MELLPGVFDKLQYFETILPLVESLPIGFFWVFFLDDKTSVPDVLCSCSFILRAQFETSLVIVSCYGYDVWRRSRWSSQFWVKIHVFQLLSTIIVNLVAKITQTAYSCVIFHVKHKKKNTFVAVLTWFLILGKIQVGGQDGDHCWWRQGLQQTHHT